MRFGFLKIAVLAALAVATLPGVAHAIVGTYTWDPSLSGGTADGGTGTWNSTNANWFNASTTADTTWTSGFSAIFDTSPGTVTLGAAESVNNLFFNTSGYSITGANTLTLGGSITVVPGGNATINPTLSLSGDLDVVGGTAILGAKLSPSASGALIFGGGGSLVIAQTATTADNFANGGVLNGNLVIATTGGVRVNFNSLVGSTGSPLPTVAAYSGSGAVQVQAPFTILSNTSGTYGGQINMTGGIQLNTLNLPFNKFDVTQAVPAYSATGAFSTAIGATKNGNFNGYLQINTPVTGNSDVAWTTNSATAGGGAGVTLLNAQCTYTGTTLIEGNGGVTAGYVGGSLILGTSNALPVGTDVEFGDLNGSGPSHSPEIDMNGNNQQIGSLSSLATFTNSTTAYNGFYIANNAFGTVATLTVSGNTTPYNSFNGQIVDYTTTASVGGQVALVKAGSNTLRLTGIGNTYSGGTTLNGGVLDVSNTAGSATGSGPVTLNGGMLESDSGSIAGNVIAGSGPHAIAPGGLGNLGTLVLGGSLSLNGNSTLNFDVSGGSSDFLQIAGPLSVGSPASIDIDASGPFSGTYTLADYASSPISNGDFNVSGVPPGYQFEASSTQLILAPVPEPSTLMLAIAGAILGFAGYRRGRRKA